MDCKNIHNNIFRLREGSLAENLREETLEHISKCPECRGYDEYIKGIFNVVKQEKNTDPGESFTSKVMSRLEEPERKTIGLWPVVSTVAAAAVVVFGIFTGMFLSNLGSGQKEVYADLPDEFYYTNEIHLEAIENFFLINNGGSYEQE